MRRPYLVRWSTSCLGERDEAKAHGPSERLGRGLREHADAEPRLHHAGEDVEALHLHAKAQGLPGAARLVEHEPRDHRVALEPDEVVVEELREGEGARTHRVPARHDGAERVGAIVEELQARRLRALHDDADVGGAAAHRLHDRGAALLPERELDGGVGRREGREVARQVLRERGGVRLDAHQALRALRIVRDLGAHRVDLRHHLARVEEERGPRGRELDPAGAAMQELHAELVLEPRDAPAQRGERDVARLGRLGDAFQLRDADEEGERGNVGAHSP